MANEDWYPRSRPAQRAMYANFLAKIDTYAPTLVLLPAQTARLKLICEMYIGIYDWLVQLEATAKQAYEWRDDMEGGNEIEPAQPPSAFQGLSLPVGAFKGFVTEFREKVRQIKGLDNYTETIGEDLKIVAVKGEDLNLAEIKTAFAYEVLPNYTVRVSGKMQNIAAAKFSYRRRGTTEWQNIGFLTGLPGTVEITPAQAATPEAGDIRARFFEKNEDVGQFSENTEITLS